MTARQTRQLVACAVAGCERQMTAGYLCCSDCWKRLPQALQRRARIARGDELQAVNAKALRLMAERFEKQQKGGGLGLAGALAEMRAGGVDDPESLGKFTRPMKPSRSGGRIEVDLLVVPVYLCVMRVGEHELPHGWKMQFLVEQDARPDADEPSWYRARLIQPGGEVAGEECGVTLSAAYFQLCASLAEDSELEAHASVGSALCALGVAALACAFGGVQNG